VLSLTSSRYKQSTTDGVTSHLSTFTADPKDCPDNLVSSFDDASEPEWRVLETRSQSTLRKRLFERDDKRCVFTAVRGTAEAVSFVKQMHPFWVCCLT
jgi:hypothetical protein